MATNLIDTGAPRSVPGHIVSGTLASAALSGALNYDKVQKGEMHKNQAIQNTVKLSVQGGIATGSAIAAANYAGNGNVIGMLGAVSLGFAGVYMTEKFAQKLEMQNQHKMKAHTKTEIETPEEEV